MSLPGSDRAVWALPLAILAVAMFVAVSSLRPAEGATTLTVCAAGPPGCTYTTIQAALDDIPNLAPDTEYALQLGAETYTENITVNVSGQVEFVGAGAGSTILDGGGTGRVIDFQDTGGSELTLRDLTVTGGNAAGNGGGVLNGATLNLYDVIMQNNAASSRGGAIHSPAGTSLTIEDAAFAGNTAGLAGSAIQASGTFDAERTLFDGGVVDRDGGASGTAQITDSAIVNQANIWSTSAFAVSSSWWGHPDGPGGDANAGTIQSDTTSTSHITGLTVTPSDATPTTGASVTLTVTPTLSSGTFDGALTASVTIAGPNSDVDVDDASGDPATTSYTGADAGEDTVTATMIFAGQTGGAGALTGTATVTWLAAPLADPGGPYAASEGAAIDFDGTGSTSAVGVDSYLWDFGDSTDSTDVSPSHTYADNGAFTVTLTVTDANGSDTATTNVTISNVAPSVSAGGDESITVGQTVTLAPTFTDPGASDAPWTYTVDWGDGAQAAAPALAGTPGVAFNVSHVYGEVGDYTAMVCVQDKDDGDGCDTVAVEVSAAPPPPDPEPETPPDPTPSPSPTPTATPTLTPTATPSPAASPSPTPTAAPKPAPTPAPTPLAAVVPAATETPIATPESTPAAPTPAATAAVSPTSTPAASAAAPSPGGSIAGSPPSGGGGAPTAPEPSVPESNTSPGGSGQQAVVSVAPGQPPASLLQSVDTSKTRGGKAVPPAEAETRAQIRNITTAGAGFSGGVVPWYASQSIDERAVAGALVSGGAFLPLMFGSGPGGGSGEGSGGTPAGGGPGAGAPGDSPRPTDRTDARRDDDTGGNDEGDDDVAAT